MSEDKNPKSNVITLLPSLIFNGTFLESFVNETPSCAALGIVEIRGEKKGFLAINTEPLADSTTQNGFDLGIQFLGKTDFLTLHLILNFNQDCIFDVLLNLNAEVSKSVLRLWEQTGDYFFFLINNGGGLTAFSQDISSAWYDNKYFDIIAKAKNSKSQYDKAVKDFKNKNMGHGMFLDYIYQNNIEYLDLEENRFEVKRNSRR